MDEYIPLASQKLDLFNNGARVWEPPSRQETRPLSENPVEHKDDDLAPLEEKFGSALSLDEVYYTRQKFLRNHFEFNLCSWKFPKKVGKLDIKLSPHLSKGHRAEFAFRKESKNKYYDDSDWLEWDHYLEFFDPKIFQPPFCPFTFQKSLIQRSQNTSCKDDTASSDDSFRSEFLQMYGDMDQSSEAFQKLLCRFKQQRRENLQNKVPAPDQSPKRDTKSTEDDAKIEFKTLVEEVYSWDQSGNAREWFLLPRKKIKRKNLKIMKKSKIDEFKNTDVVSIAGEDLTVFDPRFALPGYILDDDEDHLGNENITINLPLRQQFVTVLNNYPTGICVEKYLKIADDVVKECPDYLDATGYLSFEYFARTLPDVFWIVNSPLRASLFFPSYLQGQISTPEELFHKIWMKIQSLLPENDYILKTENIPEMLKENFGICLNPLDWCLKEVDEFYVFCEKEWPCGLTLIETETCDANKWLLVHKLKTSKPLGFKKKKHVQNEINIHPEHKSTKYIQMHEEIKVLTNDIQPDSHYRCCAGNIFNPGNFYFRILQFEDKLETVMEKMKKYYGALEGSPEENQAKPSPEHLVEDLYIAVRHNHDGGGGWYRARIVQTLGGEKVNVRLIDYGETVEATMENIRFLLREFFEEIQEQAVRCCVKTGVVYRRCFPTTLDGKCWNERDTNTFCEMISHKDLAICFKEKVFIGETLIWKVFVHLLKDNSRYIATHHAERHVIQSTRRIYLKADGEDSETGWTVQLSVLPPFTFRKLQTLTQTATSVFIV